MVVILLERQGDKVSVKRVKDGKTFLISPDTLSDKSAKILKEKAKELKEAIPPLEIDVVIGKRRKQYDESYYMKAMNITSKIKVTNKSNKIECPPCQGNIVFIGQDQRRTSLYCVLSNQYFKITPTTRGASYETKPFTVVYDSDNKGSGNIGGYKYVGYLVVLRDKDDKVIATKTTYSMIKKALENKVNAAENLIKYKKETLIDKNLEKSSYERPIGGF